MDTAEKKELPGNDASWYRALLVDKENGRAQLAAVPAVETAASVLVDTDDDLPPAEALVEADEPPFFPPEPDTAAEEPSDEAKEESAEHEAPPAVDEPAAGEDTAEEPAEERNADEDSATITAVPAIEPDNTLDNTSEMVGQLWTAGEAASPLDDWAPEEIDRKVASRRPFRWPSLLGIVAVLALIAVGLVLLPSITRSRADDHRSMFTTTLSELRSELPDTQTSLAVATDPVSTAAGLADLTTQLTVLTAKASALDAAAQAELPATPPLTSSGPIDELEPIRQRLEPLGTAANAIQRRISQLVEYRTLFDGFLSLPALPITADSAAQAGLRVTLAAAQADAAATLAELPADEALADHRVLARDLNERFGTWQVDYLEALRSEDSTVARELLAELGDGLAELDNALVAPLAQIRRDTDRDLIELAASIDEVVAAASSASS